MAYDENKLKELEAQYENGMFPYEHYIEIKKEIMGADFVDNTETAQPAAPPVQTAAPVLPMMDIPQVHALDYHVRVDNKEIGIFKRDELIEMARSGEIDKDALVYFEGIDNWIEAGNTPSIEDYFPAVPPPGSKAEKRRKAAQEAKDRAEQQRITEEKRKADELRLAEEKRRADEQKEHERKLADEKNKIEAERIAAQRRRAEEQRKLDEEARRAADAQTARIKAENEAAAARQRSYQQNSSSSYTSYDSVSSDKNQILLIILSVVLGGLGIDRFYGGRIWLGIGKIASMFMGVGFIWWIIDVVLAVAGLQKDADGYNIRGSVSLPSVFSGALSFLDRHKKVVLIVIVALAAILAGKILIDRISSLSSSGDKQTTAVTESVNDSGGGQRTTASAPAPVKRVQAETLMNGTHTFTPRLQPTRGGLPVHNIYIPQIVVTDAFFIIFLCSNASGYFRDGTAAYSNVDWDPGVDGFFDERFFTLQDLDNPSRTFRPLSAECTSNGMGKIWYITYDNVKATRLKFSGKQYFSDSHEFIFEEIIMSEPD